jgi:type II secretory pathway component PulJ
VTARMIAMISWPELLVILLILAVVLGGGVVVLFFILRAVSGSSQIEKRVERLEQEVQQLRKTPPPNG